MYLPGGIGFIRVKGYIHLERILLNICGIYGKRFKTSQTLASHVYYKHKEFAKPETHRPSKVSEVLVKRISDVGSKVKEIESTVTEMKDTLEWLKVSLNLRFKERFHG